MTKHSGRFKGWKKTQKAKPVRRQATKGMNQLERDYEQLLQQRLMAGDIRDYQFEGMKLRLAKATFYTPDFVVVTDCIEMHETKGFWEDDARVKIKVAATQFPWMRFIAITKDKAKQWAYELIEPLQPEATA